MPPASREDPITPVAATKNCLSRRLSSEPCVAMAFIRKVLCRAALAFALSPQATAFASIKRRHLFAVGGGTPDVPTELVVATGPQGFLDLASAPKPTGQGGIPKQIFMTYPSGFDPKTVSDV